MSYDIPDWSVGVAHALLAKVKSKDLDTFEHCVRVSRLSKLLAQAAGLNEFDSRIVEYAGLFHDVGKVRVPNEILLKPAKLTTEEYEIMKSHPELSVELLHPIGHLEFFSKTLPGVQYHHERFDGRGYPTGLKGENIPLASRIILVVDTFDAMTWSRPYRKGLAPEVAYKELVDFSGRQFDPKMVEIFNRAHPTWRIDDQRPFKEINNGILAGLGPCRIEQIKDAA